MSDTLLGLLCFALTLLFYYASKWLYGKKRILPLMPLLLAPTLLVAVVMLFHIPYQDYMAESHWLLWLLGPATVALALPLYENRRVVLRSLVPIVAALVVGSAATIGSVIVCSALFNLPAVITISSLPKSATSGVAMGISQSVGGDASLTAIIVVATGIAGAVMATPLLNVLRITDRRARGFAVGLAAHGVGTARAFQVHPLTGTFAGVAMSLNGLMTAVLVPLAVTLIGG